MGSLLELNPKLVCRLIEPSKQVQIDRQRRLGRLVRRKQYRCRIQEASIQQLLRGHVYRCILIQINTNAALILCLLFDLNLLGFVILFQSFRHFQIYRLWLYVLSSSSVTMITWYTSTFCRFWGRFSFLVELVEQFVFVFFHLVI